MRWPPSFKTKERPRLSIATDEVEDHIDLSSQHLLERRLSIIDHPAGSNGLEVRLIVAACRGNDGSASMRRQLHGIGAHGAGTTVDQDGLSLLQVSVGEESVPRRLGGPPARRPPPQRRGWMVFLRWSPASQPDTPGTRPFRQHPEHGITRLSQAATSLPICSTMPENSWPGIHGRAIGSICLAAPEALTRSMWLTAVLLILTKISSRANVGVGSIGKRQLPTVFQQSDRLHNELSSSLSSCPTGECRERATEFAFQASDVSAVADALEPFDSISAVSALDGRTCSRRRLREHNRPTQRLCQDLRRLRHRSHVTGDIDLAAVQGRGVGKARAPNQPMSLHCNHLQLRTRPECRGQRVALETEGARRFSMKNTGRRITCDGKRRPRTVSSMRRTCYRSAARPFAVRRPHRWVDVVFDTGLARQCRKTFRPALLPAQHRLPMSSGRQ